MFHVDMRYRSVNELTKSACSKLTGTISIFRYFIRKVMFGQAMKYINKSYFVSSPLIFIVGSYAALKCAGLSRYKEIV